MSHGLRELQDFTDGMEGYEKTEAGVIPVAKILLPSFSGEWKPMPLGLISTFITKGATPTTYGFKWEKEGVLFLRSECVAEYGLDLAQSMFITPEAHDALKRGEVRTGDILITITGNVGRVVRLDKNFGIANINQHIARIRIIDINVVPEYVFHFLSQSSVRHYYSLITTGQAYPQISLKQVRETIVSLPPLAEQKAIALTLSDTDSLIAACDRAITKKRHIKQGTMQQLLTGKMRLPGFSGQYTHRQLSEFSAFITKGATPTTYGFKWEKEGIIFLRSECVSENGLDLSQAMFISPETHNILKRGSVCSGDILITITGNVGRVIHLYKGFGFANINQHIARVRISDINIVPEFIFYFLSQSSVRRYYNLITTGQAYPQISLKQVRDTIIPLPTLSEQKAIAQILSDMDAEITALEKKRDKYKAIKKGMMQELLTGKTRLKNDADE